MPHINTLEHSQSAHSQKYKQNKTGTTDTDYEHIHWEKQKLVCES